MHDQKAGLICASKESPEAPMIESLKMGYECTRSTPSPVNVRRMGCHAGTRSSIDLNLLPS